MPVASLSTVPVMIPGPTTDMSMRNRTRRLRRTPSDRCSGFLAANCWLEDAPAADTGPGRHHPFHYVVDRHDALDPIVLVNDRHREEIVFGRDLGDLARSGLEPDRNDVLDHEVADLGLRLRHDQVTEREHAKQMILLVHAVAVNDALRIPLELA